MKRVWGGILLALGIVAIIYTFYLGIFLLSFVAGCIFWAGFYLLQARDIAVITSELKEESGVLRLYVSIKNNQKRATAVWFVVNVYCRGASIGSANSNSIMLDGLGTGELVAVLPRPSPETKKEEITWQIAKWYFK